ncbi:MBL fold metallo-hydrolase [Candidatus Odyssella thessalonicensis]|uniref:MBL fold metallo-hydrolase n=1 Tax=Candidatus Odyssella thessalonicensis TaxID=84647 RepID=UPI000225B94F|nr:MBL fold metallo-hydrolase [Candidatus Odyssella thessalonicensis]
MECIFLGHQSWLIQHKNTHILIDPVLEDNFGNAKANSIEIFPPRKVNFPSNLKIDAIILSHEHSDHFHIPSLVRFSSSPIIFGPTMFDFVDRLIQEAGLRTNRIDFQKTFKIGELEIRLYPPHPDTVLWEGRVTQIYISPVGEVENGIFIAVDALVSQDYKNDVSEGIIPSPKTIFVSNNSQITPPGVLGTLDNHMNMYAYEKNDSYGLKILSELLIDYLEGLEWENAVICGGGFTKRYEQDFGAFPFSDQKELAEAGQKLFEGKKIIGPWPGEVVSINSTASIIGQVNWIKMDMSKFEQLKTLSLNRKIDKKYNEITPQTHLCDKEIYTYIDLLEAELNDFAKYFLVSPNGESSTKESLLNPQASPYVLMIRLRLENGNFLEYGLNLRTGRFEIVDSNSLPNFSLVLFGIECFASDFIEMLRGNLQVWDMAGVSMRSWYQGEPLFSPVASFYNWFGEACRPDLAYKVLKKDGINFLQELSNETRILRTTRLASRGKKYTDTYRSSVNRCFWKLKKCKIQNLSTSIRY